MSNKVVRYDGEHEFFWHWFECPSCKSGKVAAHFDFCPMCGVKLDWGDIRKAYDESSEVEVLWNQEPMTLSFRD